MDETEKFSPSSGYLSLTNVLELVPVSRSTLYQWVANGHFPSPRKIGPRRVGWRRDEIVEWLESRAVAGAANQRAG